jgi:N-acetylmuramoyl-L-alanine amidase
VNNVTIRLGAAALLLFASLCGPLAGTALAAQSARTMYTNALGRERVVRDASRKPTLRQIRAVVSAYEAVVRRHPGSGYSDNALWQAAQLSVLAFERFGQHADRARAIRLLGQLKQHYPSSSLVARVGAAIQDAERLRAAPAPVVRAAPAPAPPVAPAALPAPDPGSPADASSPAGVASASAFATIRDIRRTPLPDGVRVSIEMDAEAAYQAEKLDGPSRVFFDFRGVRPVPALQDATLRFTDDVVREIRLGRHPNNTTRIVMDMEGAESYSVFTLYDPYRVVVDFKLGNARPQTEPAAATPEALNAEAPKPEPPRAEPVKSAATAPKAVGKSAETIPAPSRPVIPPALNPPSLPSANSDGKFSLARQLGLGVSRIVIDAGHGGHDPGARANGLSEAELVLDVAQRLKKLLEKQTTIEVVMTRATDTFIPLEERTAIANREGADLFLSIHANASRNVKARGVETYFLNFASNPEAEAVAARENSASGRTMHSLPEIVRAIALNNKLDESRDFADMVQRSMVRRLVTVNRQVKDLGVKQAPFVVLIGAAMPSVLAEISFVTHKQEGSLLKTAAYRQRIAEALFDGVLRYQQSLKKMRAITAHVGQR